MVVDDGGDVSVNITMVDGGQHDGEHHHGR